MRKNWFFFRENTAMRFRVTVRKLNMTDGQTDRRGAFQYLPSRAFGTAGDNNYKILLEAFFLTSSTLITWIKQTLLQDLLGLLAASGVVS